MKLALVPFAAVALCIAGPVAAQAVAVGTQVVDASGAAVGTVGSVEGDNLLIKTDKHEVMLPKTSFTPNNGKLLFAMTQAQLNAEIEKNLAAANAAIAAGATVKGIGGTPVATIDSVADGTVTMTLQSGNKLAVPQSGLRGNADGTVTIGYTSAQLEELVKGGSAAESKGE